MKEVEMIGKIDRYFYSNSGHEMLSIGKDILCKLKFNHSDKIYITYYISDEPLDKKEFLEHYINSIFGNPDIRYNHIYGSEWTGYMMTDQMFKVGSHDLYKELSKYHDKYCYLKIYSNITQYREDTIEDLLD